MKSNHAHVEAALAATIVLALVAVIDLFVDLVDGSPYKVLGYIALFWIVYSLAYPLIRKQWNR